METDRGRFLEWWARHRVRPGLAVLFVAAMSFYGGVLYGCWKLEQRYVAELAILQEEHERALTETQALVKILAAYGAWEELSPIAGEPLWTLTLDCPE